MNRISKVFHRMVRIITGRAGIYCTYGKGCSFGKGIMIDEDTEIGNYNYIGRYTTITKAQIGNYCSIASFAIIGPGEHPLSEFSTSPTALTHAQIENDLIKEPVKLGNDVWVGAHTVILRGVNVGNGAVIAAGAVVTKDVPDYAVVAGVPARVLRYRISKEKQDEVIATRWWDYSPDELKSIIAQLGENE